MTDYDLVAGQLRASAALKDEIAGAMIPQIIRAATIITTRLRDDGVVAFCGNGGSAADCQHLAGEFVGRFRLERPAWNAIAFTVNTSVLTALGNDYGYEQVYARQVEAHLRVGDVLCAFSTSGEAANCVLAAEKARASGVQIIAFTGATGGSLAAVADLCLCVPSTDTPRVQEAHITIGHIICDLVEQALVS